MARDSVGTTCAGVAASSSFQASGKSFKFPFFEKKENIFLSHTGLNEFPWAKPFWSLRCRGTQTRGFSRMLSPPPKLLPNYWHVLSICSSAVRFPGHHWPVG